MDIEYVAFSADWGYSCEKWVQMNEKVLKN